MSDTPGGGIAAFNVAQDPSPGLADLSEKDKPWDKHKANADTVSEHYAASKFHRYSQRVQICSDLLEFRLVPEDTGAYGLKLSAARFCRVRTCPVCQWRRSLMWKAKAYRAIPKVVEAYPKYRWLFVTFTVKNCPIDKLRATLNWMNQSFIRLTKLKIWPAKGWIKSVEVTRGKDGSAHPHLHTLLLVPPSYFSHGYISQAGWAQLWQQCLRADYQPIVDVQAIKKSLAPTFIIPEVLKYQVKESDLIRDRPWFLELTRQLHKTRAVAVGGVLRDYMRELEEEPEDLIGESEDSDQVDEGNLYFGWKHEDKRYKLADH